MKRYFVLCGIAASLLITLHSARADANPLPSLPTNLKLTLEGPLVICENTDHSGLTIWVPYLQGSHYLPMFTDGFDPPLTIDAAGENDGKYPRIEDDVELEVDFDQKSSVQTTLKPRDGNDPGKGYLYREKGDCSNIDKGLASFRVAVPIPDEVWTEDATDDHFSIKDHYGNIVDQDECYKWKKGSPKYPCQYATTIVLHYIGVNLQNFKVNGTCDDGNPHSKCTKMDLPWGKDAPKHMGFGSEFEIKLSVHPMEPDNIAHAESAFQAESRLAGYYRHLEDYDLQHDRARAKAESMTHEGPFSIPLRVACQAAPAFTCAQLCPK
jgi:hypothetical protein